MKNGWMGKWMGAEVVQVILFKICRQYPITNTRLSRLEDSVEQDVS